MDSIRTKKSLYRVSFTLELTMLGTKKLVDTDIKVLAKDQDEATRLVMAHPKIDKILPTSVKWIKPL